MKWVVWKSDALQCVTPHKSILYNIHYTCTMCAQIRNCRHSFFTHILQYTLVYNFQTCFLRFSKDGSIDRYFNFFEYEFRDAKNQFLRNMWIHSIHKWKIIFLPLRNASWKLWRRFCWKTMNDYNNEFDHYNQYYNFANSD